MILFLLLWNSDDIESIREIVKGFSKHMLNAALGQVAYKGAHLISEMV